MIAGMCSAGLTESISHNFIVQMIPHHMAAIKMSENILKYTSNPKLEEIAKGIISEQTKSIENMQEILKSCEGLTNSCCEVNAYQNHVCRIMKIMIEGMKHAYPDKCINCDFIREMIPHHMGAVRMSRNALRFPICSELPHFECDYIIAGKRNLSYTGTWYGIEVQIVDKYGLFYGCSVEKQGIFI